MKDKVIGSGKSKEVSKSPWECKVRKRAKESKWANDAQKEINGIQEPASNVIKSPMTMLSH